MIQNESKELKMLKTVHHFQNVLREAYELKNVTKSGKSPKRGGAAQTIKKVQNSKF